MLRKLGLHPVDVVLFLLFGIAYAAFGAVWMSTSTLGSLSPGGDALLQSKKDLMYAALWLCAVGYAVLANTAVLFKRGSKAGLIGFVVTLAVMGGVFFAITFLNAFLQNTLDSSLKIISIAVGDLLVLLPVITAVIVFIIALVASGVTNHLRGQPISQGFMRLGLALMIFPLIQFLVIFFFPAWDDEVRGVVMIHAMGLGLVWGLFLGGALSANLRRAPSETVAA